MNAHRQTVVALVSDAIYPYFRGGKEFRYHELSARLSRRADVHVFTMKWWDGPSVRREGHITFHATSPLYEMYVGERRSFREAIFFALGCLRLLWFRFDVLETDQFPNFHILTLRLVAWIKRKPLTVTWHEVWGPDYSRHYIRAGARDPGEPGPDLRGPQPDRPRRDRQLTPGRREGRPCPRGSAPAP